MLILSLKIGEKLVIADNVVIEVQEIYKFKGVKYTKLDVRAPRQIPVYRKELYQKINNSKNT